MTTVEFEAMAKRILEGNVDLDDLVTMMMNAMGLVGDPTPREQVEAELRQAFPTREAVVAHLQAMLAGYVAHVTGSEGVTRQ